MIQIQMFGGFRVRSGTESVEGLSGPRIQALLAYLILQAGVPQSRQQLAFLFWPESSEHQAFGCLRKLLHELRQRLPEFDRLILADRLHLTWKPTIDCRVDVLEFDALTRTSLNGTDDLRRVVELYQGELLPGCYEDWLLTRREAAARNFRDLLTRGVELLESQRCYSEAIGFAQRLLEQDPLNEVAYHNLMRLYSLYGDRAAALKTYHTCAKTLRRELAVSPSTEMRTSFQRLLKAEPLDVEPQGAVSRQGLVGRHREWQTLRERWAEAEQGRPCCVALVGGVGIGKTRVAEEFLQWAEQQGVTTLSVRSYRLERELPYMLMISILRQLSLQGLEPSWRRELVQLLPELADQGELAPSPVSSPQERRQQIFEASCRAFTRIQPSLTVVDDLQWSDVESLDWLKLLLYNWTTARMMLVMTVRTHELPRHSPVLRALKELRAAGLLVEINMEALSSQETHQLANSLLPHPLPEATAQRLYEESEGNPLFITELVRSGLLSQPQKSVPLPPTFQSVWEARLGSLPETLRRLVELLAIIARPISLTLLERCSALPIDVLYDGVPELLERGFIEERRDGLFAFTHGKLAECTAQSINPMSRRRLHLQVARALAQELDQVSVRHHVEIASHYERAFEPIKAAGHYVQAGQAAVVLFAYSEALGFFKRALQALQNAPNQLSLCWEIHLGCEHIHGVMAARQEQLESLNAMERLARQPGAESHWLPETRIRQAQRLVKIGQGPLALSLLQDASSLSAQRGLPGLEAKALYFEAREIFQNAPRSPHLLAMLERAQQLAGLAQDRALGADISSFGLYLRQTFGVLPPPGICANPFDEDPWPEPKDDPHLRQSILGHRARACLCEGRVQCAIGHTVRALEIATEMHDEFLINRHEHWLGMCQYLQGQYSIAGYYFERTSIRARRIGDRRKELSGLLWSAEVQMELGHYEVVQGLLHETLILARESGDHVLEAYAYSSLSHLYFELHEPEQCLRTSEEGLRVAEKVAGGYSGSEGGLFHWRGRALQKLGRIDEAKEALERSASVCIGLDRYFCLDETLVSMAEVYLIRQQSSTAIELLEPLILRALSPQEGMVQPQRALYVYAQALRQHGCMREAERALMDARHRLLQIAHNIQQESDRRAFLKRQLNQAILAASAGSEGPPGGALAAANGC